MFDGGAPATLRYAVGLATISYIKKGEARATEFLRSEVGVEDFAWAESKHMV